MMASTYNKALRLAITIDMVQVSFLLAKVTQAHIIIVDVAVRKATGVLFICEKLEATVVELSNWRRD